MRSLRRAWEWREFLAILHEDALNRAMTGETRWVPRGEVLIYEPEVAARIAEAARSGQANAASARCNELSLLTAQAVVDFAPELMAVKVTSQPVLFIVAENDPRVPVEVSRELYDSVPGPKKWVVIPGVGHDAVYNPPVWDVHLSAVRDWLSIHLPAPSAS
jgi:pimeloyl-ACP methyl ester carboxylesterase